MPSISDRSFSSESLVVILTTSINISDDYHKLGRVYFEEHIALTIFQSYCDLEGSRRYPTSEIQVMIPGSNHLHSTTAALL